MTMIVVLRILTIRGANQSTYDPGPISQTTYYVRCARRAGCTDWTIGESNCVVKTVDANNNCGGSPTGCNIQVSTSLNSIMISGAVGTYPSVAVYDDNFVQLYHCHTWNGGCPNPVVVNGLASGSYWVAASVTASDFTTLLCNVWENHVIGGTPRLGNSNENQVVNIPNEVEASTEKATLDFDLYPNPARQSVNISLENYSGEIVTVRLLNQLGAVVSQQIVDRQSQSNLTLSLNNISDGIYTVWVYSDNHQPIGKRLLVRKMN